ncbi:hypothetical protein CN378_17295 [Bacillus sp. AFS015802]|uniref:hypothetical protein n=1 Tax=Bacillus sp. AFS015802 TaxID=2033486 RepID=UPI000BF6A55E|nr:hypothetical protein [Bacillus sp. AFS015802]PFA62799.1 hypothetical protein CN378_17295 [Bacillus sp. AFS015802]
MPFLTTSTLTERELINKALKKEGLKQVLSDSGITRLGEGAWHYAYLIEGEELVLRIPKKVAYEKEVVFNREELTADYAGTKAFYQHANRTGKGMCPKHYNYHISEEFTYTIESYVGKSIGLAGQTPEQSKRYGREVGEFFLALEKLDSPIPGIGYISTGEHGEIKGQYEGELSAFIREETEEYREEWEALLESSYSFDKEKVRRTGEDLISTRSVDCEKRVLTNQDTSPENMIFTSNGVRMIDPFPIIYSGTSLAANYVFNYQTLFHALHDTKRHGKNQYHLLIPQLKASAEGFVEGYTHGSKQKWNDLNVEVYLKLVTMTYEHDQLLKQEFLSREQMIRYGAKEKIQERMNIFLKELEEF